MTAETDLTETAAPPWLQNHLHLATRPAVESFAVRELAPALTSLEDSGVVASWHFLRKGDRWRLRYLPPSLNRAESASAAVDAVLERCRTAGMITDWTSVIYEPETRAFGGSEGMEAAHRLFHQDSRQILAYLTFVDRDELDDQRVELSVLLGTAMMHGAGLDWYEIGDTWAKVATNRPVPGVEISLTTRNAASVLLQCDTAPTSRLVGGGKLAFARDWFPVFTNLGQDLRGLADDGRLQRGLRSVLAHHYLFHANRLGLSHQQQGLSAAAAADAVFGPALKSEEATS